MFRIFVRSALWINTHGKEREKADLDRGRNRAVMQVPCLSQLHRALHKGQSP